MNDTIQQLMRDATRLTRAGRLGEATEAIQRALQSQPVTPAPAPTQPTGDTLKAAVANEPTPGTVTLDATATVPGGNVFEVDMRPYDIAVADITEASHDQPPHAQSAFTQDQELADVQVDAGIGDFNIGTHTHLSNTLRYKLYAPPGHGSRPLPLVVMLHGCTQNPDDFAAGTGMNVAARAQGFFVLYPEQSQAVNSSKCWNWFQSKDQHRGQGEPAFIASLTLAVMKHHNIDPGRVYIAGLSAGGAMATIVAEAYPEIFGAVGIHSGLPRGSASNVMDALAVMKGGNANRAASVAGSPAHTYTHVRTIVFHGDRDQTVHQRNGEQVIAAVFGHGAQAADSTQVEHGVSRQGRRFTRSIHRDASGEAVAEHWLVHGFGHAWSGGDAAGSYTDANGPDATREMLRFFFEQPNRSVQ